MNRDQEHLTLLSIFHYIAGGVTALFALFPVVHLFLGLMMVLAPERLAEQGGRPPAFIGWMFIAIAALVMSIGWILAILILVAGRFLAKRKHYLFCTVVAALECVLMPFGTVLGVFTLIVLLRESVKQSFSASPALESGSRSTPPPLP